MWVRAFAFSNGLRLPAHHSPHKDIILKSFSALGGNRGTQKKANLLTAGGSAVRCNFAGISRNLHLWSPVDG